MCHYCIIIIIIITGHALIHQTRHKPRKKSAAGNGVYLININREKRVIQSKRSDWKGGERNLYRRRGRGQQFQFSADIYSFFSSDSLDRVSINFFVVAFGIYICREREREGSLSVPIHLQLNLHISASGSVSKCASKYKSPFGPRS